MYPRRHRRPPQSRYLRGQDRWRVVSIESVHVGGGVAMAVRSVLVIARVVGYVGEDATDADVAA